MCIMGVLEGKEGKKGAEVVYEAVTMENFPN